MQPGLIAPSDTPCSALQTGRTDMTDAAAVGTAKRIAAEARRDRRSARSLYPAGSLYPVLRGIIFALPLSLLIWAAILFLSFS